MKRLAPLAALLLLLQPIPVAAAEPAGPAQPPITVTLITGDRVSLNADGGIAIKTDRAVTFRTTRIDGTVRVVPSDVAHLIGNRLDPQLFDIGVIARYRGSVPVITSAPAGGERLASIGATATTMSTYRLGDEVWLDGPVQADAVEQKTERSLEQIEAPAAWARGLTGQGIRIAVLDTGVDPSHPDLAGRVAELANFTDSPDATDRNGHGTHVASIAAGRMGVAFDATILSGKVLGDDGTGTLSDIIAGMEWAAAQGARIVNLSLSSSTPSTGADPLSRAVDALTATHGTLFVASAGNRGPGEFGIGSPGAADSALTVGAVDRHDRVASFSSRGPRAGDHAVKPDLVAPGVDILGARAAGTRLGKPVGAHHVRLSGTSMAAPHVAGGAALLAQHRPDWTAAQLKPALAATADGIGAGTFDAGSGRLNVSRDPRVISPDPALSLGFFPYPQSGLPPAQRTLTLANLGAQAATLNLSAESADVSPSQVTIPAGGSAHVTATVEMGGAFGARSGVVKADGLRVPIGWYNESTRHVLSIRAVDRLGGSKVGTLATVVNLQDITASPPDPILLRDGFATVRVRPGYYAITAAVPTLEDGDPPPEDAADVSSISIVTVAETAIFADAEVLLDARSANPLSACVEGEDTEPVDVHVFVAAQDRDDNRFVLAYATSAADIVEGKLFVSPTERAFKGTLQMSVKLRLEGVSTYDILFAGRTFPTDMAYFVRRRDLARIETVYRTPGAPIGFSEGRFVHTDVNPVSISIFRGVPNVPATRIEYLTPGRGWHWFQCVNVLAGQEGVGSYCQPKATAKHAWLTAPLRSRAGVFRTETGLQWGIDDLADGPNSGSLSGHAFADRSYSLYRNGILLASGEEAFGSISVPAGPATYRLTRAVSPRRGLIGLSSRVETDWTFRFDRRDPVAPLLDVAVSVPVDEYNTVPAGVPIELAITHNGGRLTSLSLELSYDDGLTWHRVQADPIFETGVVSLRTSASDARGNRTTQTILHAFHAA